MKLKQTSVALDHIGKTKLPIFNENPTELQLLTGQVKK